MRVYLGRSWGPDKREAVGSLDAMVGSYIKEGVSPCEN